MSSPRYSYTEMCAVLQRALGDLEILAGGAVGPSDVSWQDVAGTAAVNLRHAAMLLDCARRGEVRDGPVVFPSLTTYTVEK